MGKPDLCLGVIMLCRIFRSWIVLTFAGGVCWAQTTNPTVVFAPAPFSGPAPVAGGSPVYPNMAVPPQQYYMSGLSEDLWNPPLGYSVPERTSVSSALNPRGTILPDVKAAFALGLFEVDWSNDGFKTLVPVAAAPAFGFVGKGRADNFDYRPTIVIEFGVALADERVPADIAGVGTVLQNVALRYERTELDGRLNEGSVSAPGVPIFNTTSNIVIENFAMQFVEFQCVPTSGPTVKRPDGVFETVIEDLPQLSFFADVTYRRLNQTYNSAVQAGAADSSVLTANADFQGLGLGAEAKFHLPLYAFEPIELPVLAQIGDEQHLTIRRIWPMALFFNLYGNFAVGPNNRFSKLVVNSSLPAASASYVVQRDRTEFVATGGFDTGIRWNALRNKTLFSVVAGFALELSSNIGPLNPLSPAPSSNDFLYYGCFLAASISK